MAPISRACGAVMAIGILLAALLGGCGLLRGGSPDDPDLRAWSPVWMPDGWVYFLRHPTGAETDVRSTLWRVREGASVEKVSTGTKDASCGGGRWTDLSALPDGRLGLLAWCEDGQSENVAMDLGSRDLTVLAPVPAVAWESVWMPDLAGGYFWLGECQVPAWRDERGLRDLSLTVDVHGFSWRPEASKANTAADCDRYGDVGPAAVVGNRQFLFVAAAPIRDASEGAETRQWELQLSDAGPESATARVVVDKLSDVDGLQAFNDGKRVLLSATHANVHGVWEVNLATGDLRLLRKMAAGYVAISPDGGRVALVTGSAKVVFESLA